MKYILIKGAGNAGKSVTINAVCNNLNPTEKLRLVYDNGNNVRFEQVNLDTEILNGTYLIKVDGVYILIVAGSPTEQCIRITIIVEICVRLKYKIALTYVNMRSSERREGYDTENELLQFGKPIYQTRIYRIEQDNYHKTTEWIKRVNDLTQLIKKYFFS